MHYTHVIERMMTHPDPVNWYHRMYRRQMLTAVQPEDDPGVITVRPYGIAKGHGMSTAPIDFTLMHYGGTLRGQKIGQWRQSLMVSTEPQPVNAPTLFAWRGGDSIRSFGTQYQLDDGVEDLT